MTRDRAVGRRRFVWLVPPVRIIVNDRHVTLVGVVFSEVEKRVAEDIARQTVGVRSLQNHLEVQGKTRS